VIERELLHCSDAGEWERWLSAHHGDSPGVRLVIPKKGRGGTGPGFDEALDVALCWGWIDSRSGQLDERHYTLTFSPRGPRSSWSARNREHIERLTAAGRMAEPGLREVERAKADGRWAAG
jgi:uncharacterized protein YdeI (YjbR/CyaY-like superfamily)